jgi:acyl-CoA thioesterase
MPFSACFVAFSASAQRALTSAARLGDTIVAKGKVLKAGKNLIFTEGQVYVGDKLIADSKATFQKISEFKY